jgi:ubiquinone/menaquinone biosynthesis C-methylase UbiE
MAETTSHFDDGAAYECFMGRWSRSAGAHFLEWVAPPKGARWLDVGCGSGAVTELVLDRCAPSRVCGVDPSKAQIEYVSTRPLAQRGDFRVADAQALPFPDATFDVVASALVINFIPDRPRAVREMRRVGRPGAIVAGYVWDFAGDRGPNQPLRVALLQIGAEARPQAGIEDTTLTRLNALFEQAGFEAIETRAIEVSLDFQNFDEYWRAQTPPLHPYTKVVATLPEADRAKLINRLRAGLATRSDGSILCQAWAHAIKARAPR